MLTDKLAELRLARNLTHKDMADKLGITRQGYGNYESGKRTIDSATLKKIADILDVDTDYLLGRTSVPRASADESGLAFYGGPDKYSPDEIEVMEAALKAYREQKKRLLEDRHS
ncbi:helix-turn-helix domain-containing protein [Paenibacillus sp. CAA11]|uniref:helix-turn-helix domain-containing protein n=1 Tax=Paenibacillus sp. CAA11 TaxID=1532905 RepID=UPI001F333C31|nr:helix-turn-helix transcriptional regulator [Paenibacillus sp. CAA11]